MITICLLVFRVIQSLLAALSPDPLSKWLVNRTRNRSFRRRLSGSRFSEERRKQANCWLHLNFSRLRNLKREPLGEKRVATATLSLLRIFIEISFT